MDLNAEDRASLYQMCTDFKIEAQDPLVGLLIEFMKVKRVILENGSGQRDGVQRLIEDLKDQTSQLGETLDVQKGVAGVLKKQVEFHTWVKSAAFIFGVIILLVGIFSGSFLTSSVTETGRLVRRLKSAGTTLSLHENGNSSELIITTKEVLSAVRDSNGVVVTLRSER